MKFLSRKGRQCQKTLQRITKSQNCAIPSVNCLPELKPLNHRLKDFNLRLNYKSLCGSMVQVNSTYIGGISPATVIKKVTR